MPAEAWAVRIAVGDSSDQGARRAQADRGNGTPDPSPRGHMAGQGSRIDDTMLIREAQRGNRAAFEELVRHYDQAVLRLALHLTGSEQDAQDILSGCLPEGLQERRQFPLRVLVLHLDLPHRYQPLPRPPAQKTGAQGRRAGRDRLVRRRVQLIDQVRGRTVGRESGARLDAPASWARASTAALEKLTPRERMVFEIEALPRTEAAHRGRDVEYDGRDGQEYAVPRHAEAAWLAGGHAMKYAGTEFLLRSIPERGRHYEV